MRQVLKRLLVIYLSALLVLLSSVGISLVLQHQAGAQLQEDARTINVSGRQRMLSQRIIYLAQDLALTPDARTRDELLAAISEFEAAIALFETSHDMLSSAEGLGPALSSHYFAQNDGPSLDQRIRAYVDAARTVASNPNDAASLQRLREIENGGLLADLNAVVNQYEGDSIALVQSLQRWEWIAMVVALGIVLVEIAFVFLPGHRFVNRAVDELESSNAELREARDLLVAKQQALEHSLHESERLRREQAEFTYAVSHDLKSPANSMQLFLSELALDNRSNLDEDGRFMLDMCQQTAVRMAEQVEDVLAYSGVTEARSLPEEVDLNEIVAEVTQNLDAMIRDCDAELQVAPLPRFVGHKTQLRILIQNLVENGIKYRAHDRAPVIEISAKPGQADGQLVLSVRDNGLGIDPEHHERIFGLFQRLHLREEIGGSGLGLCTCLRIAHNHKGKIGLTSTPGAGSTFTVSLCAIEGGDDALQKQQAA